MTSVVLIWRTPLFLLQWKRSPNDTNTPLKTGKREKSFNIKTTTGSRWEAVASMYFQADPATQVKGPPPFPTHFIMTLKDDGASRSPPPINPFAMMKSLAAQLAAKLKLTGSKFLAHDARSDQSTAIQKSTQIYKRKVIFELHPFFNGSKLIIYTSCYTPTTALSTFAAGLAKYYGVTEVV